MRSLLKQVSSTVTRFRDSKLSEHLAAFLTLGPTLVGWLWGLRRAPSDVLFAGGLQHMLFILIYVALLMVNGLISFLAPRGYAVVHVYIDSVLALSYWSFTIFVYTTYLRQTPWISKPVRNLVDTLSSDAFHTEHSRP